MPIGVPKVEYRLPGESEADWIDLYNCLYRERMLFLCQDLGDEVANQLISLMLYLNAEDPSQAFFMYINSLGGSVTCGIGVYDIMRYLESGITTICMGTASSMASFVLAGGTYGRRLSLPHGRIMIHQPEGGSDGQASEILSESTEVNRIRKQIGLIYATRTQQSIERIACDLDRDQFMSADEARAYGLIDYIAKTAGDATAIDVNVLGLLAPDSTAPKAFKALAVSETLEQAEEAIRCIPVADVDEKRLVERSKVRDQELRKERKLLEEVLARPSTPLTLDVIPVVAESFGPDGIGSLTLSDGSDIPLGDSDDVTQPPKRRRSIPTRLIGDDGSDTGRPFDMFEEQIYDTIIADPTRFTLDGNIVAAADGTPIAESLTLVDTSALAQPYAYTAADTTAVVDIPDPVDTLPPDILNRLESFADDSETDDDTDVSETNLDAVLNDLDTFEIELPALVQRGGKRKKAGVGQPTNDVVPTVQHLSIDRRTGANRRRSS